MIPLTNGEADISWRPCSHVQDPFTSRGTVTCMFLSHVQLLFNLGSDSKLRGIMNIYTIVLDSHSYCMLSIDQAFCESLYLFHHSDQFDFCVFDMVHSLSKEAIMQTDLFMYFCIKNYIGIQDKVCRQLKMF